MIPDPVHTLGAPTGHRRISLGPRARFSFLAHWRSLVVAGIALLVVLAGSVASLTTGTYPVSLDMLLDVFQGRGEDLAPFIVLEQRLPRVTGAVVIGGMLGMSGAIFQSVSRNPLGSPDIVCSPFWCSPPPVPWSPGRVRSSAAPPRRRWSCC